MILPTKGLLPPPLLKIMALSLLVAALVLHSAILVVPADLVTGMIVHQAQMRGNETMPNSMNSTKLLLQLHCTAVAAAVVQGWEVDMMLHQMFPPAEAILITPIVGAVEMEEEEEEEELGVILGVKDPIQCRLEEKAAIPTKGLDSATTDPEIAPLMNQGINQEIQEVISAIQEEIQEEIQEILEEVMQEQSKEEEIFLEEEIQGIQEIREIQEIQGIQGTTEEEVVSPIEDTDHPIIRLTEREIDTIVRIL